eukprot:NODE_445_length_7306_cov_0.516997.p5 type:complete len:198 gc:universal NODE_445_length_7306_cov_0.516997:5313-4720(-)
MKNFLQIRQDHHVHLHQRSSCVKTHLMQNLFLIIPRIKLSTNKLGPWILLLDADDLLYHMQHKCPRQYPHINRRRHMITLTFFQTKVCPRKKKNLILERHLQDQVPHHKLSLMMLFSRWVPIDQNQSRHNLLKDQTRLQLMKVQLTILLERHLCRHPINLEFDQEPWNQHHLVGNKSKHHYNPLKLRFMCKMTIMLL